MAILKDLIVHGVSRFLGAIYGEKFVKTGGTSSLFLKADGSVDSSTYLTTETDPTVPSWAKQSSKPSYTASEVGAYTETQVNNLLANKEDKVVTISIGFGDAITTDGIDASEYTKIANANSQINKPLIRDAYGSILHVIAGDNTGEYKLIGFDSYGNVRTVTVGPGVMGSDYEILDVQSMPIEQFTESDPTVPNYVKSITQANINSWNAKLETLVSGTNIKTVNNNSLVGSGNVQVGDITGEDVEDIIVDLLTSLISDALRKSLQQLTLTEKSQVLNNLGIPNVITSNNLKTINGSSIIGTGNLEVTVVDAGDINVAQSTGDSTTYVMSQKAVSDFGRKVTVEDLKGTSDYIKAKLTAAGWQLGKRMTSSIVSSANHCVTPFISYNFKKGHSITFRYCHGAESNLSQIRLYNSDLSVSDYLYENNANEAIFSVSKDDRVKFRYVLDINKISECYVYNNSTDEFIWRGDEYLANLAAQTDDNLTYKLYYDDILAQETGSSRLKLMSQDAVTRELEIMAKSRPITYFRGLLANFDLTTYPEFDFRNADGISIAFACNSLTSTVTPIFGITPTNLSSSNNGFGAEHFGIWLSWGNFKIGKITSYGTPMTGGYEVSTNNLKCKHCVITYDFKTGTSKVYYNGTIFATQTTSEYDRRTIIQDYFDTCKQVYINTPTKDSSNKYIGLAVFSHALSADEVAMLYDSGHDSIKNTLIPNYLRANCLHPLYYTDWDLYVHTGTKIVEQDGSFSFTPNATSMRIAFGFTGITGVTGMVTYEWDFEVISGSCARETYQDMCLYRNGTRYQEFKVYDSLGNDVTQSTISVGTYHVVCNPDNRIYGTINAGSWNLLYFFGICTSDFKMNLKPTLKLSERGTALEFSLQTYKGRYWQQTNGIKLTTSPDAFYNSENSLTVGNDSYINDTVIYNSSILPQFNGQMAVDTTNGKVYVGYLTGTGGTWKQINNS